MRQIGISFAHSHRRVCMETGLEEYRNLIVALYRTCTIFIAVFGYLLLYLVIWCPLAIRCTGLQRLLYYSPREDSTIVHITHRSFVNNREVLSF
jgi:hypothetical protein